MSIVESWHHEVSVEVNDLRGGALVFGEVSGFAGREDAVALHGDGVTALNFVERRASGHARINVGVRVKNISLWNKLAGIGSLPVHRGAADRQISA